jgi:hypothetical protein
MHDKQGNRAIGILFARCICSLIATLVLGAGCASEKTKPMAQPSPEQVKGNADRAFDKLKQEERDRKPAGM